MKHKAPFIQSKVLTIRKNHKVSVNQFSSIVTKAPYANTVMSCIQENKDRSEKIYTSFYDTFVKNATI